jgi:hypothetical protein
MWPHHRVSDVSLPSCEGISPNKKLFETSLQHCLQSNQISHEIKLWNKTKENNKLKKRK